MTILLERSWVKRICDFCLDLASKTVANKATLLFYGEPEYPVD